MRKVREVNFLVKNNNSPKSTQHSPTPNEIAKEALNFGKKLDLSVIESPAIRRITRSLRKELENKM